MFSSIFSIMSGDWPHNRFYGNRNSRQLPGIHPIQKFSFLVLNPLSRTGWKLGMISAELTSKTTGNAFGGQSERITSNSCPGMFSSGIFDKCLPSNAWTDTNVYRRRQLRVIAVYWASTSVLGTFLPFPPSSRKPLLEVWPSRS